MILTLSGIQGTSGKTYKAELYYRGSNTSSSTADVVNSTVSFNITNSSEVKIRVYQTDNVTCYTETDWILLDWPTAIVASVTCFSNFNRIVAIATGGVGGTSYKNLLEFAISTNNSTSNLTWYPSDAGTGNGDGTSNVSKKTFDTNIDSTGTNWYLFVRTKLASNCGVITIQNPVASISCSSCVTPVIGTPTISC